MFECFSSPNSRRHELSFKQANEFANARAARDQAQVLTCSAFIESNYEPLPTDLSSESALVSQVSYYPIHAPVVLLPFSLNNESMRIGSHALTTAMERHQQFYAVGTPECYETINWLASSASGGFTAQIMKDFDGIVVVEFRPIGN